VVLKLGPCCAQEHLLLARLQHTQIMPLYSVQEAVGRNLRVLCMPYFGSATLATLQGLLEGAPSSRRTGRDLVAALQQVQAAAPVPLAVDGPMCRFLARASYVQAICWMGACLADALHYTHERGLVHLDLKPSNVLWATDGQPMLLDLHLARAPLAAGDAPPPALGGTPAFMAPEQRLALAAVRDGRPVPAEVDGRADIYALGLLCEALGGERPPGGREAVRWLRQRNPQVSLGLADVVGRCLAEAPRQRYPEVGAIAADLRRHLANLPLRGVANRSLPERVRKWQRRQPFGPALLGLTLAVVAACGLTLAYIVHESDKARSALAVGREHLQRREYAAARGAWQRGLAEVDGLPFQQSLVEELRHELRLAECVEAAQELHCFVERLRSLHCGDGQPDSDVEVIHTQCQAVWQRRNLIAGELAAQDVPDREQVRTDLLDLAILWSDLRARHAGKNEVAVRKEALEVLDEAEAMLGPSGMLDIERRAHQAALRSSASSRFTTEPQSHREHREENNRRSASLLFFSVFSVALWRDFPRPVLGSYSVCAPGTAVHAATWSRSEGRPLLPCLFRRHLCFRSFAVVGPLSCRPCSAPASAQCWRPSRGASSPRLLSSPRPTPPALRS
jgi:hypothetical protein